jgi:hypothetical protein
MLGQEADVAAGENEPHPTSIQYRDGGGPLLRASRGAFPFIAQVFADSGYAGDRVFGRDALGGRKQPRQADQRRNRLGAAMRQKRTAFLLGKAQRALPGFIIHQEQVVDFHQRARGCALVRNAPPFGAADQSPAPAIRC